MQLVNIDKVSNGETGKVAEIGKIDGGDYILVAYPDCSVKYTREEIDQITLAYAMTIHKSQGSEYDAVITGLTTYHQPMVRRNVLYTAITRAKKKVVFIGMENALKEAIQNNKVESRNTVLKYEIRSLWQENMPPVQAASPQPQRFIQTSFVKQPEPDLLPT